jgi:two-component system OmpR family response regulator
VQFEIISWRSCGEATHILEAMSGPTRVLVVDDEQSITDFIALGLRHEGFDVRTAPDGHVALRVVDEFKPHLVVLDLMMPRVDGFTVLRQLISSNPDLASRTVVATAYPRDVANRQLNEVCQVIIKPFDTSELIGAVEDCVKRAAP